MPACLRCRTLVYTKVLLYVLCCSVQGRLKAVLLRLRYVDSMAFGALVCASWCSEEEKQVQKQNLRCLCSLEAILLLTAELMIKASSLQEEHLPRNHVYLAVGTPQCLDFD